MLGIDHKDLIFGTFYNIHQTASCRIIFIDKINLGKIYTEHPQLILSFLT